MPPRVAVVVLDSESAITKLATIAALKPVVVRVDLKFLNCSDDSKDAVTTS